jgi:MYXO-CTERM domain-containing protein
MSRLHALLLVTLTSPASASELAAATPGRSWEAPHLASDGLSVFVGATRQHTDRPAEVRLFSEGRSGWDAGAVISNAGPNLRWLVDGGRFDGRAALVVLDDPTDWRALLRVDPALPGDAPWPMPDDALLPLLDAARAVHVYQLVGGQWLSGPPVPGTRGARHASLIEGRSGVMLLAQVDQDGVWETTDDIDLVATTWQVDRWTAPLTLAEEVGLGARPVGVPDGHGFLAAWWDGETLQAAKIDSAGASVTPAPPATGPVPPSFLLAQAGGSPHLLWVGPDDAGLPTMYEAIWQSGWSAPTAAPVPAGLQVVPTPGGDDHLLQREGKDVRLLTWLDGRWWTGEPVLQLPFAPAAWDALLLGETLHVALAATPPGGLTDHSPESIHHLSALLRPDLAITGAGPAHHTAPTHGPGRWDVHLTNLGALPTTAGNLSVTGLQVEALPTVPPLLPGQSATLRLQGTLLSPTGAVELWVIPGGDDANPTNNSWSTRQPALPDYRVHALRVDGTQVVVEVRERGGFAAAPIAVELRLETVDGTTPLGQATFDPRDPQPVLLDAPALSGAPLPRRVVVRLNPTRAVREADYTNNQSSWRDLGRTNLRVVDASVQPDGVHVRVEAAHPVPADADVWVTADPEAAVAALASGWTGDGVAVVTLDATGAGEVVLPVPPGEGDMLYAVVNPGQRTPEQTRSDNRLRFSRGRTARAESDLRLDGRVDTCGVLGLRLRNEGQAPALAGLVLVLDPAGLPVAERLTPTLAPGATTTLTFPGLADGPWRVVLRRLDRRDQIELTADEILIALASLDEDADGFEARSCGGVDCDDHDPEAWPGAADWDDDCRRKVKIGADCGCSAVDGTPGAFAALLLLVIRRRRREV